MEVGPEGGFLLGKRSQNKSSDTYTPNPPSRHTTYSLDIPLKKNSTELLATGLRVLKESCSAGFRELWGLGFRGLDWALEYHTLILFS